MRGAHASFECFGEYAILKLEREYRVTCFIIIQTVYVYLHVLLYK